MQRELAQFSELSGIGPDDVIHLATGDMPTERPSDAFSVWTRRKIRTEGQLGGSVPRLLGRPRIFRIAVIGLDYAASC
jgi:hypothetical protein